MANLTPVAGWDNIPAISTNDQLIGGLTGSEPLNKAAQALANRTEELKNVDTSLSNAIDDVVDDLDIAETTLGSHTTSISTLNGQVSTINGQVSTINGQISSLQSADVALQTQLDFTQRVIRQKYDNVALNSTNAATRLFTFTPVIGSTLNTVAILNQLRFKLNVYYNGTNYTYDFEFDASEHPTYTLLQSRLKLRSVAGFQESSTTFNPSMYLIVKKVGSTYEFYYENVLFGSGNHTFTLSIYDDDIKCVVSGTDRRMSDRISLSSSLTPVAKLSNVSSGSNPITAIMYDAALMGHDPFMLIVSPITLINKTPSSYNNDYVQSKVSEEPIGTVKMWYGAAGDVPRGFAICNGSNGTPDLRDRFVIGAGGALSVGNTGGNNTLSHSASTSSAGSHSHSGTTNSAGSHAHSAVTYTSSEGLSQPCLGAESAYTWFVSKTHTHSVAVSSSGTHSHSFTTNETGSHSHTVNISSYDNRPAFMALYFIMKISRY